MVWYADYEAWGNTAKVVWREQVIDNVKVSQDELQPIRFQGQSFDTETGLHYNRFRYFDPDLGMFTTRDPIGLLGGSNVFQYAPNPTGWIDPFGLSASSKLDTALGGKVGDRLSAHHLIPVEVWQENKSFFDSIGMGSDRDKLTNGLLIPGSESAYKDGVGKGNQAYHSSNHNDYTNSVRRDLDQIKRQNLSSRQSRLKVKRLQMRLRREIWSGLRPMNRKGRLC